MSDQIKFLLQEKDIPEAWYNIVADLPGPLPPILHPGTHQPVTPDDLRPLFPDALIAQEMATERDVGIPEEVRDVLKQWRPSPLFRARRLEKALDTPARIYYKYEGVSPAGSHKPNTAVPQAYYNKAEGVKRLVTETGAGQWGSSLAMACNFFGMECKVFMVKVSYNQKPYRRALMETFGATVTASPSTETACGRAILEKDPQCTGSLGIAISEAVEDGRPAQRHQLRPRQRAQPRAPAPDRDRYGEPWTRWRMAGDYPDVVVGCTGGGSNFAGIAFPFIGEQLRGGRDAPCRGRRARRLSRASPRGNTPTTSGTPPT